MKMIVSEQERPGVNIKMIRRLNTMIAAVLLVVFSAGCERKQESQKEYPVIAPTMNVDFNEPVGQMKPVNGINNGPKSHAEIQEGNISWALDQTELYQQFGKPFVRTHDTEYPDGQDRFIDVHCIFPDFTRDPDDVSAYQFEYTDRYIENIRETGAEVFYRLGESIAPSVAEAVHQYPPEDPQKWAQVCEHIIAHYNEKWNNGYAYQIRYWEIWNEPDQARQWVGEIEQYYELYRITATYLKERFPQILIGATAPASVTKENLQDFLNGIHSENSKTPLDFLDWHIYTDDPHGIEFRAELVRRILDENGYTETLSFLGEWNYVDDWDHLDATWQTIKEPQTAAFYAACLIAMQKTSLDGAMYYDGSLTSDYAPWCGLYDGNGKLLPGSFAFQKYSELKQFATQAEISARKDSSEYGVYACAASGDEKGAVLITNIGPKAVRFQLNCETAFHNIALYTYGSDKPGGWQQKKTDLSFSQVIEIKSGEMIWLEVFD